MRKLLVGTVVLPILGFAATALCVASASTQPLAEDPCLFSYNQGNAGTPKFDAYPARITTATLHPPSLTTPEAHQFRTAIAKGATAGVNFAGRYTIVGWGCGSSCLDWAVVDSQTGRVHFDAARRVVSTVHVDDDRSQPGDRVNRTFNALRFRRDSSLLVLQGAPQEDEAREGVTFLRWTGRRFEQVGFTPAQQACREKD